MNPYITLSLVDYIQLLHRGQIERSLFEYFETELKNCSPFEVNTAIENLMIRYNDVEAVEMTVARFIRSVTPGLENQSPPEYPDDSIFYILSRENQVIDSILRDLKKTYLAILPDLKSGNRDSKRRFHSEAGRLELIKKHYLKLQYGVFSALESEGAPSRCIQLMWHLQDSIWPQLRSCLDMLSSADWDCSLFNRAYGHMFFLISSLRFREDKILYPVAYRFLSESVQRKLVEDAETYGILEKL